MWMWVNPAGKSRVGVVIEEARGQQQQTAADVPMINALKNYNYRQVSYTLKLQRAQGEKHIGSLKSVNPGGLL